MIDTKKEDPQLRTVHGYVLRPDANLVGADLVGADLADADLYGADLTAADLSHATLLNAELVNAKLMNTRLVGAELGGADLDGANLRGADLSGADLNGANLVDTDLSGCKGLIDPSDYLAEHFERDPEGRGYIAYKVFEVYHTPPEHWHIAPGSVISEVVNPCRTVDCGCGVNVATREWLRRKGHCSIYDPVWRVLIRWEWLPSVVVPYGTDGKIRCGRVELLGVTDLLEGCDG